MIVAGTFFLSMIMKKYPPGYVPSNKQTSLSRKLNLFKK